LTFVLISTLNRQAICNSGKLDKKGRIFSQVISVLKRELVIPKKENIRTKPKRKNDANEKEAHDEKK
jgi:hypothetical protein